MSQLIQIDDIQDGMELAEPVINKFGNVLLPAGAKLSSNHIKLLKTWKIFSLIIKTDDQDTVEEISKEILEKAEAIMKDSISWEPINEFEKDLIELAKISIAMELIKGK